MTDKYAVNIESGTLCPDNDKLEVPMRMFRVDRLNRTHRVFNVDFTFTQPLDESAEGTLLMDKWSNGKWINMPFFPFHRDPCNVAMTMSPPGVISMWVEMERSLGIRNPGKCPVAAGHYTMKNYVIDMTYDFPFFSGRFRATPMFRRIATKKKIFCAIIILTFSELIN